VVSSLFVCTIVSGLPTRLVGGKPYVLTPFGLVHPSCVTELPENGAHIQEGDKGTKVDITSPQTGELLESFNIPLCKEKVLSRDPFPPDYDGWLAYTSFNNGETLTSFLGNFSVPDTPASTPDILYVFTGLQNVNWIPKVDPIPPKFDIIQPVLQYPGDNGNYWSVKSWYVTINSGVQVTKELPLNVGDVVFGNMTMTGPDTWFVDSVQSSTGKSVSIFATHKVLASQPWAYTTVECYGCKGCNTEPTQSILFSEMVLTQQSGSVTPQWESFQSPNPICNTQAVINSPDSVTYTFGSND